MLLELILLQTRKPPAEPTPAFASGAIAGAVIGLFLTLAMFAGGVYVFVKWRRPGLGKVGFGLPLMLLPFTGLIVFGLAAAMSVKLPEDAFLAVPVAWLAWIVLMIVAHRSIKRQVVEAEHQEVAARKADLAAFGRTNQPDVDPDLVDGTSPDAAPAPDPAAESGPRRAVRLPKNESDGSGRASEQTIKRMTAAQIEDSQSKGPRADEVPGNPILADGEVKIRCLACDKKMKADASKFRKQRRCPACKAEPFRYVTAI